MSVILRNRNILVHIIYNPCLIYKKIHFTKKDNDSYSFLTCPVQVVPDPQPGLHVGGGRLPGGPEAVPGGGAQDQGRQARLPDLQLPQDWCWEVESKESSQRAFSKGWQDID